MKEMKDMMLQQNETVLQREIARADSETAGIECSLQQLSVGASTELSKESEQSRQELLEEIRKQQASNDAFRKMCEEALSRTVYERTLLHLRGPSGRNPPDNQRSIGGGIPFRRP
jgi:hypothetical protein